VGLPLWNQSQGVIAKGHADVLLQAMQYAKLQAQVVADVESSYAALALNRRLIERLEKGLLAQARLTRDLQRLRYQKGAASLLEYLDAQRIYIASNQEYFQSLASFWTARFQLEQAVGM
jgi:cobalt-zinc-cadmium efflux system outer membrane protein